MGERGRKREILVQLRPGESLDGEGLVERCQESGPRWNPSSPNRTPVAKERQPLGVREQLEKMTGMQVDAVGGQQQKDTVEAQQQQKDTVDGQQQRDIQGGHQQQQKDIVRDLVKALETSQGVKQAMGNQVKNLKVGLLGGLNRVMNNKQGDTENTYQ